MQAGTVIAQIPDDTTDRRAVGQNDLGTFEYFSSRKPPTLRHGQHPIYNFGRLTFVRICFIIANWSASKVLIWGNPMISADRWPRRGLWMRGSTVGPDRIADHCPTVFLPVIAFPLSIAYPSHGADPARASVEIRSPIILGHCCTSKPV